MCVDWTNQVSTLMNPHIESSLNNPNYSSYPEICVDGPFGAASENWMDFSVAILIGAGIGVTPAASILKRVRYLMNTNSVMPLTKLYFVWINREPEAFTWFHELLSQLEVSTTLSQLEIHTYLTSKNQTFESIRDLSLRKNDPIDPVTNLKTQTTFGRPAWSKMFRKIHSENKNRGMEEQLDVGVFYCGPKQLAKEIELVCSATSSANVYFNFSKEHF